VGIWCRSVVQEKETTKENRVGGIVTMWDTEKFFLSQCVIGKGYIITKGRWKYWDETITVVNVYSPCVFSEKYNLWEELITRKRAYGNRYWCVFDDFNVIRKYRERRGTNQIVRRGRQIIMELSDIPMIGRNFTWFSINGNAISKIERVMISSKWLERWPKSKQYIVDRTVSDHYAIILKHKDCY